MTLNEKIEEYISIINQSKANIHQQIVSKIINEEKVLHAEKLENL